MLCRESAAVNREKKMNHLFTKLAVVGVFTNN
jgi:hypothetical protein